jgi:glutamate-ammonia-ligase adenylyltransferase
MTLERRLTDALAGSRLAERLRESATPFLERRSADSGAQHLDGPALLGLARVLASQPAVAAFLSHRPLFLERVAELTRDSLAERERTLAVDGEALSSADLEAALDALRLRRREEMAFAACVGLAGLAPFEAVSDFLSVLAETTTQICLRLARETLASKRAAESFSVIGMGKIAGREFTHHSDLDLIFLYRGGPERVDHASRLGQRLIAYLTTMTGAGVAYAVDTRLRPSGQQGMLVTSFDGFERYQTDKAQTWEHMAMLRARPIAGEIQGADALLARVRARILARRDSPWEHLDVLRRRVEAERAREGNNAIAIKTGAGGLMDMDFLAGGGLLEAGTSAFPQLPSVRAMLEACAVDLRTEALLRDYRLLRIAEAHARWVYGRSVEAIDATDAQFSTVAELVESGLSAAGLLERIAAARGRIRSAYAAVVRAGTIRALAG